MATVLCAWIEPKWREVSIKCREFTDGEYSEPTTTGLSELLNGETIYELTYGFSVGVPDLIQIDDRLYGEHQRFFLVPEKYAYDNKWANYRNLTHYDGVPQGYQLFRN